MTALRILMVGAGAVGGFFGASLAVAGRDVTFLVRDARAQALRRDGLTIHTPDTDFTIEPVVITRDEITEPFDLVVVTVKAFAAPVAVDVRTRCAPSVPVMMLAVTPGLSEDLLIESRMFCSEFAPDATFRVIDFPPMEMDSVPVPAADVASVKPADVVFCTVASWLTTML